MKCIIILILLVSNVFAKDFDPTEKSTQVIIPFTPGGSIDINFKYIQRYAAQQKINLIPVYRPGAEGVIGLNKLVDACIDGYCLGFTNLSSVAMHRLHEPISSKNIQIITNVNYTTVSVVTHNNSKIFSINDLIRDVKNGRVIRAGQGSPMNRITIEQLFSSINSSTEKIIVPYKGGAPSIIDLVGEQIDIVVVPFIVAKPYVDSGRLKLLMLTSHVKFKEYKTDYVFDIFPTWENYAASTILVNSNVDKKALAFWNTFFKQYLNEITTEVQDLTDLSSTAKFGEVKAVEKLIQRIIKKL